MTRTVYVATLAHTWRTLSDTTPTGFGLGFLPVFESIADAQEALPGCAVYAIQVPEAWLRHGAQGRVRGEA